MSDKDRTATLPEGVEWPMVDGEPVKPGDVLWDSDGTRRRVTDVRFWREGCYVVMDDKSEWSGFTMYCDFTRTEPPKPVMDRDGVPIEVGDTVYAVGSDRKPQKVTAITNYSHPIVHCEVVKGFPYEYAPNRLTHERPDSWQRLEEDAGKGACDYFGSEYCECGGCPHEMDPDCNVVMVKDLVRRAKALAGVGGDE